MITLSQLCNLNSWPLRVEGVQLYIRFVKASPPQNGVRLHLTFQRLASLVGIGHEIATPFFPPPEVSVEVKVCMEIEICFSLLSVFIRMKLYLKKRSGLFPSEKYVFLNRERTCFHVLSLFVCLFLCYSTILDTTPEATVRPPSLMAKRNPSSMATGVMSSTLKVALSPGITISTPSAKVMSPVTSVVLK